jgi:hypothetical protein
MAAAVYRRIDATVHQHVAGHFRIHRSRGNRGLAEGRADGETDHQ